MPEYDFSLPPFVVEYNRTHPLPDDEFEKFYSEKDSSIFNEVLVSLASYRVFQKENAMTDSTEIGKLVGSSLKKRVITDQIESLLILARQRGLPVTGFSPLELEQMDIVDLSTVLDGLHELVYAPPARR